MILFVVDDRDARALLMILAVMTDPGLAQHLVPKAEFVVRTLVVGGVFREWVGSPHFEGMRRRAHPDYGSAAIQIVIKVPHLLRREILEPEEHDREIRRIQRLHARHVRVACDDLARQRVDIKKHRALEAVVLGQYAREFR